MFKVYGDYGYTSETLLEEFASFDEAVYWVERYMGDGDFGGHEIIEVAEFAGDEYVVLMRWDADDYRDETVWDQADDDFALLEDF